MHEDIGILGLLDAVGMPFVPPQAVMHRNADKDDEVGDHGTFLVCVCVVIEIGGTSNPIAHLANSDASS